MEIFTAKVPITYTKEIEIDGMMHKKTVAVGYMFTSNLLASMQEHKNRVDELLRR